MAAPVMIPVVVGTPGANPPVPPAPVAPPVPPGPITNFTHVIEFRGSRATLVGRGGLPPPVAPRVGAVAAGRFAPAPGRGRVVLVPEQLHGGRVVVGRRQ